MKKTPHIVSVIIVTFNGKHWLSMCLPSLMKQTYKHVEIIIVDNNSKDGTQAWIKKEYKQITLIELNDNIGFAEGNNIGFKQAHGTYIYFLNNDTTLSPSCIQELVQPFKTNKRLGGIQSKMLLMDDNSKLDTIGAFLTPTGFLYHNKFSYIDKPAYDVDIPLYTAKGASMMFRADVLHKVLVNNTLFDPDYFAYFEETDLCHRVWLAGYEIRYCPKAIITHKMGATSSKMNNAYVQYHSFKNRIATYIKNLEISTLVPILFVHFFVTQLFVFISLMRGNGSLSWNIEKAFIWNITHFRMILVKRMYIQKSIRKQSDAEFIRYIMKYPAISYYIHWLLGKPYYE